MKLTFLGTGTSQGVPVIACDCDVCLSSDKRDKRLRSSVMISINNLNYLIDCGPDFRQQMLREQIQDIRAILLIFRYHKKKTFPLYQIGELERFLLCLSHKFPLLS